MKLKVFLDPGAKMPTKAHPKDAGFDLCALNSVIIPPGEGRSIETGVHMIIPEGYGGLLVSKSGLNVNNDLTSTGLIDADYTGAIKVKLYNQGNKPQLMREGWKCSQIVILRIADIEALEQVDSLDEFADSERGMNGFGSSGE